jgi:hypothetical protein
MTDIENYGFKEIKSYLPWRAVLKSSKHVVELFARNASFTCPIPDIHEYRLICAEFFKQLSSFKIDRDPSIVEFYVQEYKRIVESTKGPANNYPYLYIPHNMSTIEYGQVIWRLIRNHSVIPRIPLPYLVEKLAELYLAINDDEAMKMLLTTYPKPIFDTIWANILAQQIAIPSGLVNILYSNAQIFKSFFVENASFPLTRDMLSANPDLLICILREVSNGLKECACNLLVHVL